MRWCRADGKEDREEVVMIVLMMVNRTGKMDAMMIMMML